MARPKRTTSPIPAAQVAMPRAILLSCPICQNLLGEQSIGEHMDQHRPVRTCCKDHTEWTLDLDAVINYRPDVSPFYCRPCGKHAPVIG